MKKELVDNNKCLMTIRKSRKSCLLEYSCGIFLLLLLGISVLKRIYQPKLHYFVLSLALFSFVYAEGSRLFVRYKIMPKKTIIIKGIIKQNRKNVYFHPLGFVTDINVKQGRLQRLLNYGTIYVQGAGGISFEIKDISHPHQIMNVIEDLIEKSKHPEKKKI